VSSLTANALIHIVVSILRSINTVLSAMFILD
jgi:hypothetical protein